MEAGSRCCQVDSELGEAVLPFGAGERVALPCHYPVPT